MTGKLRRIATTILLGVLRAVGQLMGIVMYMVQHPLRAPFYLPWRLAFTAIKLSSYFTGLVGFVGNRLSFIDSILTMWAHSYVNPESVELVQDHSVNFVSEAPSDLLLDEEYDELPNVSRQHLVDEALQAEQQTINDFRRGESVFSLIITGISVILVFFPDITQNVSYQIDLLLWSRLLSGTAIAQLLVSGLAGFLIFSVIFRNTFIRILSIDDASIFDDPRKLGAIWHWNRRTMRSPLLVTEFVEYARHSPKVLRMISESADDFDDEHWKRIDNMNTRFGSIGGGFLSAIEDHADSELPDEEPESSAVKIDLDQDNNEKMLSFIEAVYNKIVIFTRFLRLRSMQMKFQGLLGKLATDQGDPEKAIEYHQQALELAINIDDGEHEAFFLCKIAASQNMMGNHESATDQFKKAIDVYRNIDPTESAADAFLGLAMVYHEKGRTQEAIRIFDEGISFVESAEGPGFTERTVELKAYRADIIESSAGHQKQYEYAINCILKGDDRQGKRFLEKVWDRKDEFEPGSEGYELAIRAGVLLAAYAAFTNKISAKDRAKILSETGEHTEVLPRPAVKLHEQLVGEGDFNQDGLTMLYTDLDQDLSFRELFFEQAEAAAIGRLATALKFQRDE